MKKIVKLALAITLATVLPAQADEHTALLDLLLQKGIITK